MMMERSGGGGLLDKNLTLVPCSVQIRTMLRVMWVSGSFLSKAAWWVEASRLVTASGLVSSLRRAISSVPVLALASVMVVETTLGLLER